MEEECAYILTKLWQEYRLLEQFMYKNKNQQRHFPHFRALQRVLKDLRFLHQLQTFIQSAECGEEDLALISEEVGSVLEQTCNDISKAGAALWKMIYMQLLLGFSVCTFCVLSRLMYLVQATQHLVANSPAQHPFMAFVRASVPSPARMPVPSVVQKHPTPIPVPETQPDHCEKAETKDDAWKKKEDVNSKISKKLVEKSKFLKSVFGILDQVNTGSISGAGSRGEKVRNHTSKKKQPK